jgi:hypothetical protein
MIINIDSTGKIQMIAGHGLDLSGEGIAVKRRASHVEPVALLPRLAFHLIRRLVNDDSRLAGWTRRWRCLWRVAIVDGPILPGAWRDRLEAIAAEVEWIERERFGA